MERKNKAKGFFATWSLVRKKNKLTKAKKTNALAKSPKKPTKKTVNKPKTLIKKPRKLMRTQAKKSKITAKKPRKFPNKKALTRFEENPIIQPKAENDWEAWQTFNPGVIMLDNVVHFLYRAIGEDGLSRFGYAKSRDGVKIDDRLSYPVYEHKLSRSPSVNYYSFVSGGGFGGTEDPRIVRVDDEDRLYVTYTACDNGLGVAIISIKVEDFLSKKWDWSVPQLISQPGEVHKNWVIFPEKIKGKYAILHSISPEIQIEYVESLDFAEGQVIQSHYQNIPNHNRWDSWVRGAGAPPVRTEHGWLLFYQAMEGNDFSKYKVGVMLLDLNDPTKIISRAKEPVLEPEESYEFEGFKPGVIYVTGAVVRDGILMVYYGSADSHVSVACASLDKFVHALLKEDKPKLKVKRKIVKKR